MENRKNKRSVRLALVLGAAVAGTALVGWGGLAAWQAYTQNSGSAITVGVLSHSNTVQTGTCHSGTTVVDCNAIFTISGVGPAWTGGGGSVTLTSTGSLDSTFAMEMPSAPVQVGTVGSFCPDLTLTVKDSNDIQVYSGSLESAMTSTGLSPANNTDSPWKTSDTNTYTFTVSPPSDFSGNALYMGLGCAFDVLFTQTSA